MLCYVDVFVECFTRKFWQYLESMNEGGSSRSWFAYDPRPPQQSNCKLHTFSKTSYWSCKLPKTKTNTSAPGKNTPGATRLRTQASLGSRGTCAKEMSLGARGWEAVATPGGEKHRPSASVTWLKGLSYGGNDAIKKWVAQCIPKIIYDYLLGIK